ncbi:MAG: hypothetical protein SGJ23_08105 [Alphaproteobacteria bacterium]|nr:hypothetical protein [Alphaproteobacteria bacterium]
MFMAAVAGAIAAYLLVAPAAHAETAWWRGQSVQNGRATPFEGALTIENGRVTGRFSEINTFTDRRYSHLFSTVINGTVHGRTIRFGKFYDGFARIAGEAPYTGTYDAAAGMMQGTFTFNGARGTFTLRRAASPPSLSNMPNTARFVAMMEGSAMNRLAGQFNEVFWAFSPSVAASGLPGGRLASRIRRKDAAALREHLTETMALNLPNLQAHANQMCSRLTPAQREALRAVARERYAVLTAQLARRRGDISRVMVRDISGVSADVVPLRFSTECGAGASSGAPATGARDEIVVGDDLLLSAVFATMYVDSLFFVFPDRALANMETFRGDGRADSQTPADLSAALLRLRALPLWENTMRQQRVSTDQRTIPLHMFEGGLFWARCPDNSLRCWFDQALTYATLSHYKSEALLQDQVDFVLAHEIGHYALQHFSAVQSCDAELPRERDADFFAVALIRPPSGLFTERRELRHMKGAPTDARFQSGVELFMTQDYHGLMAGGCQYPPISERIAAAKAFEARVFPPARP